MTTDGSFHINDLIKLEVLLPRGEDTWETMAARASEWLFHKNKSEFPNLTIQAFFSDQEARPDNRLSRYFRYTKLETFKKGAFSDSEIIYEDVIECDDGLFFWIHFKPTPKNLPDVIERLRHTRGDFIFMAENDFCARRLADIMIPPRLVGKDTRIDQPSTRLNLIGTGIRLIRTWGSFDDREMWVEVY